MTQPHLPRPAWRPTPCISPEVRWGGCSSFPQRFSDTAALVSFLEGHREADADNLPFLTQEWGDLLVLYCDLFDGELSTELPLHEDWYMYAIMRGNAAGRVALRNWARSTQHP